MSRWFRLYPDAIRNPKVAALNDAQFRLWIELLSVASDNGGLIPCLDRLKHVLKRRLDHLSRGVNDLVNAGLMDVLEGGYEPHNWTKFQYKSDTSTDRVRKHRGGGNVSMENNETPPETEADTETEILEPKGSCASGDTHALKPEHFVEAWNDLAGRLAKPRVRKLTPERRVALRARINGYTLEEFQEVLSNIERSPFLRGEKSWSGCTFDWVTKKANFQKILEGNYNG